MSAATDKVSAALSHAELYNLRDRDENKSRSVQNILAPMEHQAFAREFAQESPLLASVSLPFAIPAYYAAKKLGLQKARSDPSWEEVKGGYTGLMQGLFQ